MKCPLNIEVFSKALLLCILSISGLDHAMFILWLQLPQILLVNVVNLLLCMDAVPEEKVIDFVVILTYVLLDPNLVYRIGPHAHSPDVLTMLNVQVLGQFGTWSVKLIDETDLLRCLKLTDPLVHELAW